jgi:integrase
MAAYLREHAPTRTSAAWIADMATDILRWWGDKPLSEVNGRNCRAYVEWRTAQRVVARAKRNVGVQTARHELSVLKAAIRYYHREHGPLTSVPEVTLPAKAPPREDYFWTREEAARRLRAARRRPDTHHLVRLFMIGIYSGTRPGAMMRLRWLPSTDGGWIDVDNEVIHRRPYGAERTRKRQPPARIHQRLLPHLRKWRREDQARGIAHVIHYAGKPVKVTRWAWNTVRKEVGSARRDSPHILRHTAATWFMSWGVDVALIAGYLGMSVKTLVDVYGHHHPSFQSVIAQSTPRKRANQKRTG